MSKCPHCLSDLNPENAPRSLPQHRRFFGMIRAMFSHWPETAEFQPESEAHLRSWAICKAGFNESADVPLTFAEDQPGVTRLTAQAIEAAFVWAGNYAFVRPDHNGGRVRIYRAKSIAFHKMAPSEFNILNDKVAGVLAAETGLDPDRVMTENERAA